jgi:hypothetical protein
MIQLNKGVVTGLRFSLAKSSNKVKINRSVERITEVL